ncbi:hypothetical protein PENTCL1PPCAC_21767, partial [Pristionchus entomophagus]
CSCIDNRQAFNLSISVSFAFHTMEFDSVRSQVTTGKLFVTACLGIIFFINAFDAHGVEGVVPLIQINYDIKDAQTATIRTFSTIAQTITYGLIWILGDVFDRRKLFLVSLSTWITLSLCSIVLGSTYFVVFVAFRSLAASASSAFTVLTPVILADLWRDRALGVALMFMSANELMTTQITAILNSWIVTSGVPWQSGLIAGPLVAIVPLIGLLCASRTFRSPEYRRSLQRSFANAFSILKIKSFVLIAAELTCGAFFARAFWFWFPTMLLNAWTDFPDAFFGFSYTTVTTFNSLAKIAGNVIGLPTILWIAQSWRHGTGLCSGREGFTRAYPIVVSAGASVYAAAYFVGILMVVENYIVFLGVMFFVGLGASADMSLSAQMKLMVVPTSSRPAAVALSRLISGIVTTPAAQLAGLISDTVRGDSMLPSDRFRAYQLALLCTVSFLVLGVICDMLLVVFFPEDCRKAEEIDEQELKRVDESTYLIGTPKSRSESVFDTLIRSRTTTLNSY